MPSSPNYKRDYVQEKLTARRRGELKDEADRQRLRYHLDKEGINHKGKDISHKKAARSGGTIADGYTLESPHTNRARNGHNPGEKKGK